MKFLTSSLCSCLAKRGCVIGIGRVKTPTLGIVCLRELEIRDFRPEDYFEIAAQANVAGGSFAIRHAPPPKQRVKNRLRAEAIARAADGHRGPLGILIRLNASVRRFRRGLGHDGFSAEPTGEA
ncbi:MAG: DNA topoisomerase [Rhodomicrobium sp.]